MNKLFGIATVLLLGLSSGLPEEKEEAGTAFPLEEVSVFDAAVRASPHFRDLMRGDSATCVEEAPKEGKAWPEPVSAHPLYGCAHFDYKPNGTACEHSFLFMLDESEGEGKGYDRLYLDLDRDGDLKDAKPLERLQNPPDGAISEYMKEQACCFESVTLPFGPGPDGNARPVEVLPRLYVSKEYTPRVSFIPTHVRMGPVRMEGDTYTVILAQVSYITGRYDLPYTGLMFDFDPWWWGGDQLRALHEIHGKYYGFEAAPQGDHLKVTPYAGEMGELVFSSGKRDLQGCTGSGSLRGDHAVAVGRASSPGDDYSSVDRMLLPVGDYTANFLIVSLGPLNIEMSYNYHGEGTPGDRGGRPIVYGMKISKERPFVFDFSNEPAVIFAAPVKEQRFKPGDEVEVMAVLVDPVLDVMIRGLDDTSRQIDEEYVDSGGEKHTYRKDVSLDPVVTIRRTSGEIVSEGVMPFG